MSIYTDQLQKAYIAYFGRPADPTGLAAWDQYLATHPNGIGTVYAAFAASAEYKADYPASLTNYDRINAIYNNLFHRNAEGGVNNVWFVALNAGQFTIDNIVIKILEGASGSDLVAVNSKVAASNAFTAALDQPNEISGYSGSAAAAHAKAWLSGVYDAPTQASATQTAALNAAVLAVIADDPVVTNLTGGQDNLLGGSGNDIFNADQNTLQLGDTVHGGDGQDTLKVSVSGSGATLTGFEIDSVETIIVKSLATGASTFDLSDVTGVTTIVSNETEGASLTFRDIQSVNGVNISVVDTNEVHTFTYDASAYTSGVEATEISLQEIRNENDNTVFYIGTTDQAPGASLVDEVDITSSTVANELQDLRVGGNFRVLNINGNANLAIVDALDVNLTTVDAHLLSEDLSLNLSEVAPRAGAVNYTGAQGDNFVTFGSAANTKTIITFGGEDEILAGQGNNNITSGAGNDSITTGLGDDTIVSGDDQDVIVDAGGDNLISSGAGADGVNIYGVGDNNIDLGSGNDTLVMQAEQLEVADTITGGTGIDTFELHNEAGSIFTGEVTLSETQRTTSIEIFDLQEENIYLTLTDNLVETAQDNSLTVRTLDATGTQTVDITNISAPTYSFTLIGGEAQDIVIADDQTVNSMSSMSFGDGIYFVRDIYYYADDKREMLDPIIIKEYAAVQDTLVVVNGATIRESDTRNIDGLERIELTSDSTRAQRWVIELTDALLDQTTDVNALVAGTQGTLTISVDGDVPEQSELYLTLDPATVTSDVNVLVERNSNVTVYLNGVRVVSNGIALNYAGDGALHVETALEFTANGDSLVGTDLADTFYADTVDDIGNEDFVNGYDGYDTLLLGAGVYAAPNSIHDMLDGAALTDIEELSFSPDVDYGVAFTDSANVAGVYDIYAYELTEGNDEVRGAVTEHEFDFGGGTDVLYLANGALDVYVDGGADNDVVYMDAYGSEEVDLPSSVTISDVESVYGSTGENAVTVDESNSVDVYAELGAADDTVYGSYNDGDTLLVYGGTDTFVVGEDAGDEVYGYDGNDDITTDDVEYINGGEGQDSITTRGDALTDDATISGGSLSASDPVGSDNDLITLNSIGEDMVVFGTEAAHAGSVPVFVSSGYDLVNNFAAGADVTVTDDILDVSGLIANGGVESVVIGDLAAGIDLTGGGEIGVIWNASAATINDNMGTAFTVVAGTAGRIAIDDNGEAVIAYTSDAEGDNVGFVTLAYVCDTDAGVGQTWEVTTIGTVTFDELTGLNAGTLGAENFLVA